MTRVIGPSGPLSRRLQHPTDDQMDLSQGLEASAFDGKPATTGVTTAEQTKVAKALAKKAKTRQKMNGRIRSIRRR